MQYSYDDIIATPYVDGAGWGWDGPDQCTKVAVGEGYVLSSSGHPLLCQVQVSGTSYCCAVPVSTALVVYSALRQEILHQ